MEWILALIGPTVSVIILLIGGAVMFGKFKEKCEDNDKKIERVGKNLSKRVAHLEDSNVVTKEECNERSELYKNLMCSKIDRLEQAVNKSSEIAERDRTSLSKQIIKNRDDVISRYDKINIFIGETRSIMTLLKTKFLEENM